jgi:hypothetical protein
MIVRKTMEMNIDVWIRKATSKSAYLARVLSMGNLSHLTKIAC